MGYFFRLIGTTNTGEVDSAGQQRVVNYDSTGTNINSANKTAIGANTGGMMLSGNEYKVARTLRTDETGTLRTNDESLMLYDNCEGAAVNTNTWVQTTTTMTIAQSATTGVQFNNSNTLTTGTGALQTSHRHFPFMLGSTLLYRTRVRATAFFANSIIEFGFGAPTTATALTATNGAYWRRDTSGQWLPVLCSNSSEILGTPISNATFVASVPATEYFIATVELRHAGIARFALYTQAGALITSQDMELASGSAFAGFNQTHMQCFERMWNSGAVGTVCQLFRKDTMVTLLDALQQRDYRVAQSGMGLNSTQSPTAFTQLANWTNNTAPTARTLSNTAAAEATLGGLVRANSIAGGNTDYILFGWQNPSPYTFYFTGIRIPAPINEVVPVAVTNTTFANYGVAFNSSAVSLATTAPYAPRMVQLGGVHNAAITTAVSTQFTGSDVVWTPGTPIAVFPGRFLHVTVREIVGTATATETYQWSGVTIDGFFE